MRIYRGSAEALHEAGRPIGRAELIHAEGVAGRGAASTELDRAARTATRAASSPSVGRPRTTLTRGSVSIDRAYDAPVENR